MAKLSVAEELVAAIKAAANEAREQPSRTVAEAFYDGERALVRQFEREWIIEKLAALIRQHRARLPKPPKCFYSAFGCLPGFSFQPAREQGC